MYIELYIDYILLIKLQKYKLLLYMVNEVVKIISCYWILTIFFIYFTRENVCKEI